MMPSTLVPSLPSLALSPSHSHSRDEWASDLANFETSKGSRRKNNKCRRDSGDSQSRPCRAAWARGPRVKSATGACDSGTSRIHTGACPPLAARPCHATPLLGHCVLAGQRSRPWAPLALTTPTMALNTACTRNGPSAGTAPPCLRRRRTASCTCAASNCVRITRAPLHAAVL